jgi:flavoprotein
MWLSVSWDDRLLRLIDCLGCGRCRYVFLEAVEGGKNGDLWARRRDHVDSVMLVGWSWFGKWETAFLM